MPGAPNLLQKSTAASIGGPAPRTQAMPGQVNAAPRPALSWGKLLNSNRDVSPPPASAVAPVPEMAPAPVPAPAAPAIPATTPAPAAPVAPVAPVAPAVPAAPAAPAAPSEQTRPANAAAGESIAEQDHLAAKYNETFITRAAKKTAHNTGRSVNVTTSLVKLNWRSTRPFSIYKYDLKLVVRVNGVEKKSLLNKDEMKTVLINLKKDAKAMEMFHSVFWSDFKSLFFAHDSIPQTSFTVNLDEKREVDLIITPTETITMTDMFRDADERFIQAFSNAIMYETLMEKGIVAQSSKVYYGKEFGIDEGLLEGRMGINYNFRVTEQGLMLAVDQCATAFIVSGPLINTVKKICGRNFNERSGAIGKKSQTDVCVAGRHEV